MPNSKIEVEKIENIHYCVNNISQLKKVVSPVVTVRGVPWTVVVSKETSCGADVVSVGLSCDRKDVRAKWSMIASASFYLLSTNEKVCQVSFVQPSIFQPHMPYWCEELIDWEGLMKPANGFIIDDSIKIKVSIEAYADHSADSIQWKKMPTRKSRTHKFRMAIPNIDELAIVRSPTFELNNRTFAIDVAKAREVKYADEFEEYLTVHLRCLEVDTRKWQVRTRLFFSIVPFKPSVKPFVRKDDACDVFDKDNSCFGWTDLMTWKDFKDPAKCYIENDHAVFDIEIQVEKDGSAASSAPSKLQREPKPNAEVPASMEIDAPIDDAKPSGDVKPSINVFIECLICSKNMVGSDTPATECGHLICTSCIVPHLSKHRSCPNCKTYISKHVEKFAIPK